MTAEEFEKTYWSYFLSLESDFINTEKYVTLDKDNWKTFSIEYIKIFQIACAEIDVLAKAFCREIYPTFNKETLPYYCKIITTEYPDFTTDTVRLMPLNLDLDVWKDWEWHNYIDKNGKQSVRGKGPRWWIDHNDVKHSRTFATQSGLNYKKANQKNAIFSLAALFQLESYVYKRLTKYDKVATNPSKLFKMIKWEETVLSGSGVFFELTDKVDWKD